MVSVVSIHDFVFDAHPKKNVLFGVNTCVRCYSLALLGVGFLCDVEGGELLPLAPPEELPSSLSSLDWPAVNSKSHRSFDMRYNSLTQQRQHSD